MASNQQVILQAGTVSADTCFESVQQLYNTFVDKTTAYVAGSYSLFNYGDTVPSVDDQDRPWIRTINGLPDKIYTWISGQWASKHPVPTGSSVRMLWVGSLGDLNTYDGGSAGTASSFSGPFWEQDTAFDARFPVGVGDFAAAVTNTGGEKDTTLEEKHLPPHSHSLKYTESGLKDTNAELDDGEGLFTAGSKEANGMVRAGSAQNSESFTNLPPYYGVYFIKRTAREYYTV
tara:strand:+ start:620 stop:1315 length:696 start_codon:yes stop_codon:yes gene_type:complete